LKITATWSGVAFFSLVAEADFSVAVVEAEPGAGRARPAAWVAPVAEPARVCFEVVELAVGALEAAPVVDAAVAEVVAVGVAVAVADALAAEPVADAEAAAPVCSVAEAPAAAELVAYAAAVGQVLACSVPEAPAADEFVVGPEAELAAGARVAEWRAWRRAD
jgi:hypothetical protein